jgi:hypothetical protein
MGSLRYFLEREVSNGIIEQLEKLDAADGGTARMDAASWAPGRLFLELIIRTSFLQATAGTRRCICGARQPAAGRCELDLGGPVQHHRLPRGRVEKSGEGDATWRTWQDAVFQQSPCLHGAAQKEPALLEELEAFSGLSFLDSWEPVRDRNPELLLSTVCWRSPCRRRLALIGTYPAHEERN